MHIFLFSGIIVNVPAVKVAVQLKENDADLAVKTRIRRGHQEGTDVVVHETETIKTRKDIDQSANRKFVFKNYVLYPLFQYCTGMYCMHALALLSRKEKCYELSNICP